jgi:CheY-like chemotaxis protein
VPGAQVLGALAGAAAEGVSVDVVLMDIMMTRLDGVSAVGGMRRAGWATPVIAVTGNSDTSSAAECALQARGELILCCTIILRTVCSRLYVMVVCLRAGREVFCRARRNLLACRHIQRVQSSAAEAILVRNAARCADRRVPAAGRARWPVVDRSAFWR